MKASLLIEQLQELKRDHGDLEVHIPSRDLAEGTESAVGVAIFHGEDDLPVKFDIVDQETFEAFMES